MKPCLGHAFKTSFLSEVVKCFLIRHLFKNKNPISYETSSQIEIIWSAWSQYITLECFYLRSGNFYSHAISFNYLILVSIFGVAAYQKWG